MARVLPKYGSRTACQPSPWARPTERSSPSIVGTSTASPGDRWNGWSAVRSSWNSTSHGALKYNAFTSTRRVSSSTTPAGRISGILSWVLSAVQVFTASRPASGSCAQSTTRIPAPYDAARVSRNESRHGVPRSPNSVLALSRAMTAGSSPLRANEPASPSTAWVSALSPPL